MKSRKKNNSDRVGVAPGREEWDFSGCPAGREYYCWAYEYARESPSVVEFYREATTKYREMFDEHGNWHYERALCDESGEFVDAAVLELPRGFPEVPYLRTGHVPYQEVAGGRLILPAKVRDVSELRDGGAGIRAECIAHLQIDWSATDGRLTREFRAWLKKHRPFKAWSSRGKSAARKCMADLKALGAYRLMKTMTAEEALTFTKRVMRNGLYAKVPDWYEARKRAKELLRTQFRAV